MLGQVEAGSQGDVLGASCCMPSSDWDKSMILLMMVFVLTR